MNQWFHVSCMDHKEISVLTVNPSGNVVRASNFDIKLNLRGKIAPFHGKIWMSGEDFILKIDPGTLHAEAAYWSTECTDISNIYSTDGGLKVLSKEAGKIFYMDFLGEYKCLQNIAGKPVSLDIPYVAESTGAIINLDSGSMFHCGRDIKSISLIGDKILIVSPDGRTWVRTETVDIGSLSYLSEVSDCTSFNHKSYCFVNNIIYKIDKSLGVVTQFQVKRDCMILDIIPFVGS